MKNKWLFLLVIFSCCPAAARTFTDSTGRASEIPEIIDRVVPSGPIAQMTLMTFAPEKVVALSNREAQKVHLTPADRKKQVIGQLYGAASLNLEELAVNNPQLFVDIGESKEKIKSDMNNMEKRLGIQTVHIDSSLKNTAKSFLLLGELLNEKERGAELSAYTQEIYDRILSILSRIPVKKRLLYLSGNKALSVLGKGSFHGQVIDLMGDNVAVFPVVLTTGAGNEVNLEQILNWNPEYIIADAPAYNAVLKNSVWQAVPAVKEKKIFRVPDKPYSWVSSPPAVNRFMGLIWLAKILYPEYADYDLFTETKRFYKLFYRQDLSRGQFDALTAESL